MSFYPPTNVYCHGNLILMAEVWMVQVPIFGSHVVAHVSDYVKLLQLSTLVIECLEVDPGSKWCHLINNCGTLFWTNHMKWTSYGVCDVLLHKFTNEPQTYLLLRWLAEITSWQPKEACPSGRWACLSIYKISVLKSWTRNAIVKWSDQWGSYNQIQRLKSANRLFSLPLKITLNILRY